MVDADRRDSRLSLCEQERLQARKGSSKTGFRQNRMLVSMMGDVNKARAA